MKQRGEGSGWIRKWRSDKNSKRSVRLTVFVLPRRHEAWEYLVNSAKESHLQHVCISTQVFSVICLEIAYGFSDV